MARRRKAESEVDPDLEQGLAVMEAEWVSFAPPKPILVVGHIRPEGELMDFNPKTTTGKRLERLLGVEEGHLNDAVDCANLLKFGQGVTPANMNEAADAMDLTGRELLVLCGSHVHAAFGHWRGPTAPSGVQVTVKGITTVLLPHPSGQTRWTADLLVRCSQALSIVTAGLIEERWAIEQDRARHRAMSTRTRSWREEFLKRMQAHGVKSIAARQVGVSIRAVDAHIARDPEFALRVHEALGDCIDFAESEVARRAILGVPGRPFIYKDMEIVVQRGADGKPILDATGNTIPVLGADGKPQVRMTIKRESVTEYSDPLLLRFLARHRPQVWSERRKTEIEGSLTFGDLAQAALAAGMDPGDEEGES